MVEKKCCKKIEKKGYCCKSCPIFVEATKKTKKSRKKEKKAKKKGKKSKK